MNDPYLRSLANRGASFSNFAAVTHPSYPNYVGMIAGSYYGISTDAQTTLDVRTVADLLEARGLNWSSYAENYPGNCFLGVSNGLYQRKHEPYLSIKSIQASPTRCAKVVNSTQFQSDWQNRSVSNYAMYVPNMDNDGHDTGVAFASAWLQNFIEPLLADQVRMNGTVFQITFDESAGGSGNRIYNVLIGPSVKPGFVEGSARGTYDMLRMIEDNFNLGTLGLGDARATSLTSIWASN